MEGGQGDRSLILPDSPGKRPYRLCLQAPSTVTQTELVSTSPTEDLSGILALELAVFIVNL